MQIDIVSQQGIQLELTGQSGGVNSVEIVPGGLTSGPAVTVELVAIGSPSFTIDGLATNIEISHDIIVAGASDPTWSGRVTALESAVSQMNKPPIAIATTKNISDEVISISDDIKSGVTDPEGGTLTLLSVTYSGTAYPLGQDFTTTLGVMNVGANGVYTFTLNSNAKSLNVGQTSNVVFGFTVMDEAGSRKSSTHQITVTGTNQGPVATSDYKVLQAGQSISGNVLANDIDYEGSNLSIINYNISGVSGDQPLNQGVIIPNIGTFSLASSGAYTFTPLNNNVSGALLFNYSVTDGTTSTTGALSLSIAPPPPSETDTQNFYALYRSNISITNSATNPPQSRPLPDRTVVTVTNDVPPWNYSHRLPNQLSRPSSALDFEVGVGKPYTDIDQVPWEMLLPGDRVFIHYRPTAYNKTIVITSSGLPDAWIEIIGVKDPSTGALPIIDGDGAICMQGSHADYADGAALITFAHMTAGAYGMVEGAKPRYIHVTGLELKNAHPTKNRTKKTGTVGPWGEFASAFYGIGFENICIQGNKMHNCGLGIFVNSILAERFQSRNLHICNNWIYNCSSSGSFSTHSSYTEAIGTIYEHNYIQRTIISSNGDTIKDRSSGIVIRYNYIETSANAVSLRDPSSENSNQNGWFEVQSLDTLGELTIRSAFLYGNTFINNVAGPESIIAVGDGANMQYREGSVYFYNNVVMSRADGISGYTGIFYDPYRVPLFGMLNTRSPITLVARNNLFYTTNISSGAKTPTFGIFYWQGLADFSSNWINDYVNTGYDTNASANLAKGSQFTGSGLGGLVESTASPNFVGLSVGDYDLLPSSPYFSLTEQIPPQAVSRNLQPVRRSVLYPFGIVPLPVIINPPTISGNAVVGNTLTVGNYSFTPLPSTYSFKWYRDGVVITGATSSSYTTQPIDVSTSITAGVTPTNSSGTGSEVISSAISVLSSTSPVNTVQPSVSGSSQVTFQHSVTSGTWTNNPTTFSYQVYLDGVSVAGQTTSNFTPSSSDVGKVLQWLVTATNANNESSFAMSNSITLQEVSLDPDYLGKWNFAAVNNTNLRTLSSKWNGVEAPYNLGFGYEHFTCQSGTLQCTGAAGNWTRTRSWYENGQSEDVSVEASIKFSSTSTNNVNSVGMQIALRQTPGQFYTIGVTADGVFVNRNGTRVSSRTDMTITSPAVLKVIPNGGTLSIYVNGILSHTYVDDTPLTGGYPGVSSHKDGQAEIDVGMEWWTDSP